MSNQLNSPQKYFVPTVPKPFNELSFVGASKYGGTDETIDWLSFHKRGSFLDGMEAGLDAIVELMKFASNHSNHSWGEYAISQVFKEVFEERRRIGAIGDFKSGAAFAMANCIVALFAFQAQRKPIADIKSWVEDKKIEIRKSSSSFERVQIREMLKLVHELSPRRKQVQSGPGARNAT